MSHVIMFSFQYRLGLNSRKKLWTRQKRLALEIQHQTDSYTGQSVMTGTDFVGDAVYQGLLFSTASSLASLSLFLGVHPDNVWTVENFMTVYCYIY